MTDDAPLITRHPGEPLTVWEERKRAAYRARADRIARDPLTEHNLATASALMDVIYGGAK